MAAIWQQKIIPIRPGQTMIRRNFCAIMSLPALFAIQTFPENDK
jgi:hypothetical protein